MSSTNWLSYKGDKLTAPKEVKGYNKLSEENKKLFEDFLKNYYKDWEYPEEHQPIKVEFVVEEDYLRVEFKDMWLHVKGATVWY